MLDKRVEMCYNNYGEREQKFRIAKQKIHKREVLTMTRYNDNWFDVMFDEAVEEAEREAQAWEEEEANRFF